MAKVATCMGDPHGDPQSSPQHADPHGFGAQRKPYGSVCCGLVCGSPCGSPMWVENLWAARKVTEFEENHLQGRQILSYQGKEELSRPPSAVARAFGSARCHPRGPGDRRNSFSLERIEKPFPHVRKNHSRLKCSFSV